MSNPTPTREDRERALEMLSYWRGEFAIKRCQQWVEDGDNYPDDAIERDLVLELETAAIHIATARAEGEAQGRAELRSAAQDRILELERSMRNVLGFCSKLTYRLRNRPGFVVDEEALQHLLRFCADAGFESSALREDRSGLVARADDATRNVRREDDRA